MADLVKNELASIVLRIPIVEIDLKVTARVDSNSLRAMVSTKLDLFLKSCFDRNFRLQLHLKLNNLFLVGNFVSLRVLCRN